MKFLELFSRLLGVLLDAINYKRKRDSANNPSDTIANGGRVQSSETSFSDLADKAERDKTK